MNTEIALWALGIFATLAMSLAFAILASVQRQGRDTNVKVTQIAETQAGLVSDTANVQSELIRLRDNVHRTNGEVMKLAGARELGEEIAKAIVAALDSRENRPNRFRASKD